MLPLFKDLHTLVAELEPEAVLALFHAVARYADSFIEHPSATAIATIDHLDPWLSQNLNGWANAAGSGDKEKVIVAAAGFFSAMVQNAAILLATAGEAADDPVKTVRRLAGDMVGTVIAANLGSVEAKQQLAEMVPFYSWLLLGEKVFEKWETGFYYEAGKEAWGLVLQAVGDVTIAIPIVKGGAAAIRMVGTQLKCAIQQGVRKNAGKFLRETRGFAGDEVAKRIRECRALGADFCFPPGTPVLMADGTTKPIEKISVGDIVLADDPSDDRPPAARPIAGKVEGESKYLVLISYDTNGDGITDGTLQPTPNHPVWTRQNGWIDAQNLAEGHLLLLADGATAQVLEVEPRKYDGGTWNLSIGGEHGFYVVNNGFAILVHNTNPGERSGMIYDVPIRASDVEEVRRKPRTPGSGTPASLTEVKDIFGNTGEFKYFGRASVPGLEDKPEEIFKRRYSKIGGHFGKWVDVPGTEPLMQARVRVARSEVSFKEVVQTRGTLHDTYKYQGQPVQGSNGRPYTNLDAYLRGKEWEVENVRREAGLSVNPNQPLGRNPNAAALKEARKLPYCRKHVTP